MYIRIDIDCENSPCLRNLSSSVCPQRFRRFRAVASPRAPAAAPRARHRRCKESLAGVLAPSPASAATGDNS